MAPAKVPRLGHYASATSQSKLAASEGGAEPLDGRWIEGTLSCCAATTPRDDSDCVRSVMRRGIGAAWTAFAPPALVARGGLRRFFGPSGGAQSDIASELRDTMRDL
ncbi:hypothetical protein EYZ11_010737 [Aspergillus tanneri]|uniref:Uncharacterized protein n=1 Tax=Aspergillus tanneri TaxID=1220188 RepID=A0A4S3J6P8_9EURO|nr:hypothetical protein EYZ11_010737 [Aspergillus tanneri]